MRARLDGDVIAIERAYWMPWDPDLEVRANSKWSIPICEIDRAKNQVLPEPDGSLKLPSFAGERLVAILPKGAAPSGRRIRSGDSDVTIDVERSEVLRCAVVDAERYSIEGARVTIRYDLFNFNERERDIDVGVRCAKAMFEFEEVSDSGGLVTFPRRAMGGQRIVTRKQGMSESVIQTGYLDSPPGHELLLFLHAAGSLTGSVIDDLTGQPIADTRLEVGVFEHRECVGSTAVVFTDASGVYRAPAVVAEYGSTLVTAMKTGYASETFMLGTLAEGEAKRVDFRLKKSETFRGVVLDVLGKPVPGVRVGAADQDRHPGGFEAADTDSQGRFEFIALEKDRPFLVIPQKEGYATRWISVTSPWRQPFEVRLEPVRPFLGRLVAEGYPLSNPTVRVVREDRYAKRSFEQWGEVDPSTGDFVVKDVPGGTYIVDAFADGYAPTRVVGVPVAQTDDRKSIEVKLERGAPVTGRLIDDETSIPIVGATIFHGDPRADSRDIAGVMANAASTDSEGRFRVDAVPLGRRVVLIARQDGYASEVIDFESTNVLASANREIRMQHEAVIEVRARLPDGAPAQRMTGTVTGADRLDRVVETTDGVLRFKRLRAGKYDLTVSVDLGWGDHDGMAEERLGIDATAGQTSQIELSFGGGATIRARVHGDGFRDYPDRFVIVAVKRDEPEAGRRFYDLTNYGRGTATLVGLVPGEYEVSATAPTGVVNYRVGKLLTITGNETIDLDFEVTSRTLTAIATDVKGNSIDSVRISVRASGAASSTATSDFSSDLWRSGRTDSEGRTWICGFRPGSLEYVIERDGFARIDGTIAVDPSDAEKSLEREFQLEPECRLSVAVGARGGERIAGPALYVESPRRRRLDLRGRDESQLKPDGVTADGRSLFHGLGTDVYTLHAEAPGFFPLATKISCTSGADLDVDVELRRLAPYAVRLRDAKGAPMRDVGFVLADLETNETVANWLRDGRLARGPSTANEHGEIRFEALPLGRYRLEATGIATEIEVRADFEEDEIATIRAAQ